MRRVVRGGCAMFLMVIFLALVAVIVIMVFAPTGSSKPQVTQPVSTATPTGMSSVVPFGQTAHTAGWTFRILGVNFLHSIRTFDQQSQAQGIFVFVRLRITNEENESSVLNSWDYKVVDARGRIFDMATSDPSSSLMDLSFEADSEFGLPHYDTRIQPSLSMTTGILFDVAPYEKGLKLRVQDGTLMALSA